MAGQLEFIETSCADCHNQRKIIELNGSQAMMPCANPCCSLTAAGDEYVVAVRTDGGYDPRDFYRHAGSEGWTWLERR